MNEFIIFVIGFFISLISLILLERQDRDITLKILLLFIFFSLFSWFAVAFIIFALIYEKGDNIVIVKKTKPKKETYNP